MVTDDTQASSGRTSGVVLLAGPGRRGLGGPGQRGTVGGDPSGAGQSGGQGPVEEAEVLPPATAVEGMWGAR